MTVKQKTGRALSVPGGVALGLLAGMAVTVAGAAICAVLISGEKLSQTTVGLCSFGTLLAASVVGALVTAGSIKRMRVQMCLLSGGCYYLSLLGMTALLFGGSYTGMGASALGVLLGAGIVAAMGAMPKKRNAGRVRKRAYR